MINRRWVGKGFPTLHILGEGGSDRCCIRLRALAVRSAFRLAVKGLRRLTEASCRDAQQVHSLGVGRCAMTLLRELSQRGGPRLQAAKEGRRLHGCSVSSARTGRSFEGWNAAESQTDRVLGIGLSRSVPITIRFEERHQPLAHGVDGRD